MIEVNGQMSEYQPGRVRPGLLTGLAIVGIGLAVTLATGREKTARSDIATLDKVGRIGNPSYSAPSTVPRLLGAASCTAANCHGGPTTTSKIGGEYSTWIARDPHARAYSVLRNEESREMVRRLNLSQPAHESVVCLNCHSAATTTGGLQHDTLPTDGVSCEQCHGPAEHWVAAHLRADWKKRLAADKQRLGFRDLKDILTRARTCAECHVGAAGRDVNHDLIAAGHPRLFFELSAFHANLPAHWRREADAARHVLPRNAGAADGESYFETKLWLIGQVASAEASLKLLSQRASLADEPQVGNQPPVAWPELSEWSCFACHHDLQSPSWRQGDRFISHPRGQLPWNTWYLALLEPLAKQTSGPDLAAATSPLAKAWSLMAKPFPKPADVRQHADAAARDLTAWAEWLNHAENARELFSASAVRQILERLTSEDGIQRATDNWDAATQMYLGWSALAHAGRSAGKNSQPDELEKERVLFHALDTMRDTLKLNFPTGFNSPRTFAPEPIERLPWLLQHLRRAWDTLNNSMTP